MITNVNAISTLVNMLVYTSIEDIQVATPGDALLQKLYASIMQGLPHKKRKLNTA